MPAVTKVARVIDPPPPETPKFAENPVVVLELPLPQKAECEDDPFALSPPMTTGAGLAIEFV